MKEFKSKVGYEILIPVLTITVGVILIPMMTGAPIEAIVTMTVIILPTIAFILHMFYQTSYRIVNDKLLIKSGFLYQSELYIYQINSVTKTRNLIASPAASLDRIEVKYGKWDSVIISPKDKVEFMNELLKINPKIQHNLK